MNIGNFMALKQVFCRGLSNIIFSCHMIPADVTGIRRIDILPTGIHKYKQNQLGKQVYYPDFHISAHS